MNKNPNFYWQSSPQAVLEVNSFQTQAFSILLTVDQHPWWITRLISHTHQPQGSVIHTSISCGTRDMWVPAAHHGQWQKHWLLENPLTRARHLPITFSVTWVGQSYFKMTGIVFTSYKDHGYQPRNGRGASALSMSSHMAGGTAARCLS